MKEYLDLACSPIEENCVQVSSTEDYIPKMKEEVGEFYALMGRLFPIPESAGPDTFFFVKRHSHDFGPYWEVCIAYDPENPISVAFAFHVEANLPMKWSDTSAPKFAGLEWECEECESMNCTEKPDLQVQCSWCSHLQRIG